MRRISLILLAVASLIPCFPGKAIAQLSCFYNEQTYRIATCTSECNSQFCGRTLPFLGKKSRGVGLFVTYHQTGDANGQGTITIGPGQTEGIDPIRFWAPTRNATLYMYVDEIPDYAVSVQIRKADGTQLAEMSGRPNEEFSIDLPDAGEYRVNMVHRNTTPGGPTVAYVPTAYLVPTIKPDLAGNTRDRALNLGALVPGRPLEATEFLQRVFLRNTDGTSAGRLSVDDTADWYRFTTSRRGRIKANFRSEPVLESSDVPIAFGFGSDGDPVAIPVEGTVRDAGTHYLAVKSPEVFQAREFGHSYRFEITFEPE